MISINWRSAELFENVTGSVAIMRLATFMTVYLKTWLLFSLIKFIFDVSQIGLVMSVYFHKQHFTAVRNAPFLFHTQYSGIQLHNRIQLSDSNRRHCCYGGDFVLSRPSTDAGAPNCGAWQCPPSNCKIKWRANAGASFLPQHQPVNRLKPLDVGRMQVRSQCVSYRSSALQLHPPAVQRTRQAMFPSPLLDPRLRNDLLQKIHYWLFTTASLAARHYSHVHFQAAVGWHKSKAFYRF